MQQGYLILAGFLAVALVVAAQGPPGWEDNGFGRPSLFQLPTQEEYALQMTLTGTATDAETREGFLVDLDLEGIVVRTFPLGPDGQRTVEERGTLQAIVHFLDPESRAVLDSFRVPVSYDAQVADGISKALDAWQFTMVSASDPDAPFSLDLAGSSSGLQVAGGQVNYLLVSEGGVEVQDPDGHRATDFHLDAAGAATRERVG